jgi:PPP family 3-phenylpropionic acid transporter
VRTIWPFAFYVLFFASFAFMGPFMVLYYQSLEFTGTQIGLLTGITPLITLVCAPLWTSLADATRRHRLIMSVAILVGATTISAFPLFRAFTPILLMATLLNAFFAPVSAFADSATMYMLADRKEMYGRIRLGGTVGFGLAAPLAGALVQKHGLSLAFWGCAALMLLAFVVSQSLVHSSLRSSDSARQSVGALATNLRWLLFLTVACAGGVALAGTNIYLFPHLKELGANESTMGLALTLGTLSEIPVLFLANRLLRRLTPYGLLMLAMALTGVRLLAFAASSTPNHVLWSQLLNGVNFPAMWVAGVAYANDNAPAGLSATAQGMFGAMVFGFGAAIGGFIGGPLLEIIGGRGLYLVFGVVVLITVTIVALVHRRLPAEQKTSPTVTMN